MTQPSNVSKKVVDPFTPLNGESQAIQQRFEGQIAQKRKKAQKRSLVVLVWGPGTERGDPIARKRWQIWETLRGLNFDAQFSEHLIPKDRPSDFNLIVEEGFHAEGADLIIMLIEGSAGALTELTVFCQKRSFREKVYVMAPKHYNNGGPPGDLLNMLSEAFNRVLWYEDGDIDACKVLTAAIKRAVGLRNWIEAFGRR